VGYRDPNLVLLALFDSVVDQQVVRKRRFCVGVLCVVDGRLGRGLGWWCCSLLHRTQSRAMAETMWTRDDDERDGCESAAKCWGLSDAQAQSVQVRLRMSARLHGSSLLTWLKGGSSTAQTEPTHTAHTFDTVPFAVCTRTCKHRIHTHNRCSFRRLRVLRAVLMSGNVTSRVPKAQRPNNANK
jgi:hypothetical protein